MIKFDESAIGNQAALGIERIRIKINVKNRDMQTVRNTFKYDNTVCINIFFTSLLKGISFSYIC